MRRIPNADITREGFSWSNKAARQREIIVSLDCLKKSSTFNRTNIYGMVYLKNDYDPLVKEIVRIEPASQVLKDRMKLNALSCGVKRVLKRVQGNQSQTYELTSKLSIQEI